MEVDEALQHFLTMDSSGLRGTWRAEIAVSLKSLSRRSSWSSEPLHCAKKTKTVPLCSLMDYTGPISLLLSSLSPSFSLAFINHIQQIES